MFLSHSLEISVWKRLWTCREKKKEEEEEEEEEKKKGISLSILVRSKLSLL
jgi:hypothetical protein